MSTQNVIEVDHFLAHPPAKVWRALVDPVRLAAWFMPNDFVPAVGHRFTLHRRPDPEAHFSPTVRCEVLALEDERLLSYSWTDGGKHAGELDSVVTWTLRPEGRGTRLFLEHRGFRPDDPLHRRAIDLMTGGWRLLMGTRLPASLDLDPTDPPTPHKELTDDHHDPA